MSVVRPILFLKDINLLHRTFHTGHSKFISEKTYQKIKLTQAKMQRDDGVPVFLKCGTRDKIVYYVMLGLVLGSTIQTIRGLYKLSKEY